MDRLDHPRRQLPAAALMIVSGAAAWLGPGDIPAALTALAFLPYASDEHPHVLCTQFREPLLAQSWDQVQPNDAFIALICLRPTILAGDLAKPIGQVLGDRPVHRCHRQALVSAAYQFGQLSAGVIMRPRVGLDPLVRASSCRHVGRETVPAVFPEPDAAFTVGAPTPTGPSD
jgi:hypothetical protein